ncbi:putative Arf GTPase activating protein [Helianthus annuus]|uniref:Arf GTPase activating protein n=1 Tax=Helianthus annuus TaxID=4232 RepID=A0A251SFS0_HELAN|nr:putative Arf GTPase activating protein [Helianthus annuus]KAJ0463785.1 putative Arf GTPase activating protein [Helianthus annuus]KAJ0655834.1 putative Arf GTPase activating protein [Helianthus annuus]
MKGVTKVMSAMNKVGGKHYVEACLSRSEAISYYSSSRWHISDLLSPTIGVFICLKCCSVHRSLGPNVSKVLLATIDEWAEEEMNAMVEVRGNSSANSIYEAHVPKGVKPGPDASLEHRTKFIRSKYEFQEFLNTGLKISNGAPARVCS